jgi:hypothetical protein
VADCCAPNTLEQAAFRGCCECGDPGRSVEHITLKALLRPLALERLTTGVHHFYFCTSSRCSVVYFGDGDVFRQEDVLVPVFQKCAEGLRTVCYCLEIREDHVRDEVEAKGVSASSERIKSLVQSGRCACELRNPQGTCCLGNVAAVVRGAQGLRVT